MIIRASAPGKAILFGEHAVVYGRPAIAIPLSGIRAHAFGRATAHPLKVTSEILTQATRLHDIEALDRSDPLALMAALTARHIGATALKGEIRIQSDLPIASGLGSGAAVSAALGRAIAGLAASCIADGALNEIVFEVEKLHHGTPSGIDNSVVVYEKPVYFVKDETLEFVRIGDPLYILLGDTGIGSLTRDAVAHVRSQLAREPAQTAKLFDEIAVIVDDARASIASGAAAPLGELMTANHALLCRLGLSSAELDTLVDVALKAGALGAKLSGGGRGGHIIALVDRGSMNGVRDALIEAGAKRVLATIAR
jgi:mevalonate kinase